MLIDDLKALQERRGFLAAEDIREYAERTNTPLYQIQAVASFYPHFRLEPPPRREIHVWVALACHLKGAPALHERLRGLACDPEAVRVHACSCLGQCDAAPAVMIDDVPLGCAETLDDAA